MAQLDYSTVVDSIQDYYGTSREQVWDIINDYNLTPAQAAELLPQQTISQTADGVYRLYNNNDEVISYNQQVTIPVSQEQSLLPAINSNTQTGTAPTTVKTQFAGNSVIDQNGKIKTEAGVTEYKNGVAQQNTALAVVATARTALSGWSVGMSLGKAITSDLYNRDPVFFSAYNPDNWNSITANMGDTGIEGLAKKAINYLLKIDPSTGNTQAYMSEEAYMAIAYALAKKGLFDASSTKYPTKPGTSVTSYTITGLGNLQPILVRVGSQLNTVRRESFLNSLADTTLTNFIATYELFNIQVFNGSQIYIQGWKLTNGSYIDKTLTLSHQTVNGYDVPYFSTGTLRGSGASTGHVRCLPNDTGTAVSWDTGYGDNTGSVGWVRLGNLTTDTLFTSNVNVTQTTALPGVSNQTGATVPNISSNDTKQQVIDKIHGALPGLENDRLEQSVVQPDGTTKLIKYYPVPMPSDTTDTVLEGDKHINITDPIEIILPEGETITTPDGVEITGDGTTPVEIPAGEYDLPAGTTITNNYIYNTTNITGGSQSSSEVTDSSLEDMLKLVITMLTNIQPQSSGQEAEENPSTEDTNPPDTGEGTTPPLVVPVGTASALWSVYNPTLAEINSLGGWLWSSNFIDQLLKMFNDPMQAIIGLHRTFIPPITGSRQNIQVGYLDSGVSALTVPTQYSTVDCGNVSLPEYFGNVFDYAPYTRVYIYLPFIGFKELDVSQVMRSTIKVMYHGDAYTGTGLAEVYVTRDAGAGGVLYSYGCECAVRYPLSQGSYMGFATAVAGLALGIASGNVAPALLGFAGGSGKRSVEQSGGFSGNSGAMGIKKPYLVVMRPQTAMPSNYRHYSGAPSSSLVRIGNTSGLIRVRECHVENIASATREEKAMIEQRLTEGIIV